MVLVSTLVLSCRELRLAGCPPLTLLACPIFLSSPSPKTQVNPQHSRKVSLEKRSKDSMDRITEKKLKKKVLRQVGTAITDFQMIEEGDRVMVCISGGKDSWCMLYLLEELQKRAPVSFELLAVHLDQGEPYAPVAEIEAALNAQSVPSKVIHRDLYTIVETKLKPGQTRCSLCSRLRRGTLYNVAAELGCTKIALGHHRDDLIETLLLNQFFAGRISSMPPRLTSDDGKNVVIRPLAYVAESDLTDLSQVVGYPVFSCISCDTIEGQRKRVKRLLASLEEEIPGVKQSLLRSLSEIRPSQLMDKKLWSFGMDDEVEGAPSAASPSCCPPQVSAPSTNSPSTSVLS
ncbi:MAG: tRNA 2-thiocytidine(32) synthetase TtcA [Deltaproteobacteria bacterium]|nr:MAG: tRNA 2-thiocytidine(32) synthetase TtcA [Deltaproteobacteria bacterium]